MSASGKYIPCHCSSTTVSKSATGLEALSFQNLEVSIASAPLLLMQFCQPVIKPKTLLMQLHILQACQGLDGLCLFLTDPRNQALCTMPARMELVKLVSCRLYA